MSEERDGSMPGPTGREDPSEDDARLLLARQDVLDRAGGTCSVSEAAAILDISEEAVRERLRAGRLLSIDTSAGEHRLPRVQFADSGVLPGLEEVLAAMNVSSAWMRLQFARR